MVAAALRGLGLPMGVGLNNNHEDIDFFKLFNDPSRDRADLRALVDERDRRFDVWGMKSPLFVDNPALIDLLPLFRSLVLVVVFRNPFATALSYQERDGAAFSESVLSVYEKFGHFLQTALQFPIDAVGIDYEAATRVPQAFARGLAECLGLDADPADLDRAVRSIGGDGGGYLNLPGEGWSVTPLPAGPDGIGTGGEVELLTDYRSVVHSQRSFVFMGDIFKGHDHLVVYAPAHGASFGKEVRLLVQSTPEAIRHEGSTRYNVYLDLDGTFSLGLSFLAEMVSASPLCFAIASERPIRRLALGLASGADVGRQLPAARTVVSVPGG